MNYFDLHVHPSIRGGLSISPAKYTAWDELNIKINLPPPLNKFEQIINSQATLTLLNTGQVLAVVVLHATEIAFARNRIINKILANPIVTDLNQSLFDDIRLNRITYFKVFQKDLQQLLDASTKPPKKFKIIKNIGELDLTQLNAILSIEGAHCFQDKYNTDPADDVCNSIVTNFRNFKQNKKFRFHHLTLAHLSRQPACVHCFGVKMKKIIDFFPEVEFTPDSSKMGISKLGKDIIKEAYNNNLTPSVLIDIKHMSLVARKQFYQFRRENGWEKIPIIASHLGVTGVSYDDLRIKDIVWDRKTKCYKVFWYSKPGLCGTKFNPWTIGLYDEEIIEILNSLGLIGISLDQRIIGEGYIYSEQMSKLEVPQLNLRKTLKPVNYIAPVSVKEDESIFSAFFEIPGIRDILSIEGIREFFLPTLKDDREFGNEIIFPFDEPEHATTKRGVIQPSHIDYLANNILHVLKVGLENGFTVQMKNLMYESVFALAVI
ncbi:MAG: hypothetical protein M3352_06165 [Bacteroidota bacterium]|nr:hypothetical protein [Bacteroidota bacterium]